MRYKWLILGIIFISGLLFLNAKLDTSVAEVNVKIRGVSLEAPSVKFEVDFFNELEEINSNWVCLMPYAYIPKNSTEIRYGENHAQWWGEQKQGILECIEMAQTSNLKIMVKPHLWIGWGEFTGDLHFESEEEWEAWETNYRNYILEFSELAEMKNVELICIGTELKNSVQKRPQYWSGLIDEIREVYSGQLTYAGNWDSYKDFPFWEKLDYIGVDAYFPLSKSKNPSREELLESWKPWIEEMSSLAKATGKNILFTEYGYCSTDYACLEPWKILKEENVNEEAQEIAYSALFESLWDKEWFSGGFVWKWHVPDHLHSERMKKRFTPQEKKAKETLKFWYSKE